MVRWQITRLKHGCLSLPRSKDKGQFQRRGMNWETLTDRPNSYRITMQGTNQFIWWGDEGRRLMQGFIWRSDLALGAKNDIPAVDESSILELLNWPIGGIGKVEKLKGPRPSRKLLPNPEWSSFKKRVKKKGSPMSLGQSLLLIHCYNPGFIVGLRVKFTTYLLNWIEFP